MISSGLNWVSGSELIIHKIRIVIIIQMQWWVKEQIKWCFFVVRCCCFSYLDVIISPLKCLLVLRVYGKIKNALSESNKKDLKRALQTTICIYICICIYCPLSVRIYSLGTTRNKLCRVLCSKLSLEIHDSVLLDHYLLVSWDFWKFRMHVEILLNRDARGKPSNV